MLHPKACEGKRRSSFKPQPNDLRRELHPPAHDSQWMSLHSMYGNQAVLRMLSSAPATMPIKRAFATGSSFYRAADKGSGATPQSKPAPPAPVPAPATCRPQSLTYANETQLGCPPGKCGVQFKFDVTKVNTCPGDDCKGKTVGETVTTDNKCTAGGVDQGPCPNPVGDNNTIPGCSDTYEFCTDPANIPEGGCTETYTVADNVGGVSAGVCKIAWKFTKTGGACSATVSRTCTPASPQCSTSPAP
jgi:hypothetical protein